MVNKKAIKSKSSGQLPRGVLIFGGIIIIVIIIVSIVVKILWTPEPVVLPGGGEEGEETYQEVYEVVIDDIKFTFQKAEDKGNILSGSESKYPEQQKDITTKERFIEVTVGAQNIGKETITADDKVWGIKEIFDNEGRKFELLEKEADPWIPDESNCGALLKPAFSPIPCTKIYEVAKVSTDLKVKVFVEEKGITTKKGEALIDLEVY